MEDIGLHGDFLFFSRSQQGKLDVFGKINAVVSQGKLFCTGFILLASRFILVRDSFSLMISIPLPLTAKGMDFGRLFKVMFLGISFRATGRSITVRCSLISRD
jgi:hypothetical protein